MEDTEVENEPNTSGRFIREARHPSRLEETALRVMQHVQKSEDQHGDGNNSRPHGSVGWLRPSTDDGCCRGTTRRRRTRHPPHAETQVQSYPGAILVGSEKGRTADYFNSERGRLSILTMRRPDLGSGISAIRKPEEWVEIEVTVDSGACVTIMPASMCSGIPVIETDLVREGVEYEVANGEALPNMGERRCEVMTIGSLTPKRITFQVADVHKPLLSITACSDMGYDCFLGKEGGTLRDRITGEQIPLERKGSLYTLKMWVRQDPRVNPEKPFGGPA